MFLETNDKALAVELTNTFVTVASEIKKANGEQAYIFNADDVITTLNKFYKAIKELN